jgi:hypothetical protein
MMFVQCRCHSDRCVAILDRPSFCRVEPKVFDEFFGVPRSRFDREACRSAILSLFMYLHVLLSTLKW